MQQNYDAFVTRMINIYEGGYGWDSGDPGGPTKYGITCYDLAAHMGRKMDSMSNWAPIVKAMTMSTALQIYQTKYATAVRFSEVQSGCDCELMDFQVNSGYRSLWTAQAMLGQPKSNVMTDALVHAINNQPALNFIDNLSAHRLAFLQALGTWRIFGAGWGRRVADLKTYSTNIATKGPTPNVDPIADQVAAIKSAQSALNSIMQLDPPLAIDGIVGPATTAALKAFQEKYNVQPVDGVYGPITAAALQANLPSSHSMAKLLIDGDYRIMAKGVQDTTDMMVEPEVYKDAMP